MRPPDVVLAAEALGSIAALVLSGVLFLLILRTARPNLAMWLAACCAVLWSGGCLAEILLILCGYDFSFSGMWIAKYAELFSGALFPISFLMLWPIPDPASTSRIRMRRWLLILTALIGAGLLIAVTWLRASPIIASRIIEHFVPFSAAILMTAGAFIVLPGRLKTFADHLYTVLTLGGMWASGAAALLVNSSAIPLSLCAALGVVAEQAPFLTLIGTIFFFARFRAADLLIKASLKITAGTALALAAAFLIPNLPTRVSSPLLLLETTTLLGLLLLCYLGASRTLTYAVDLWILPRPDYVAALRELWNELNALDNEATIFEAARSRIQSSLEFRSVALIPLSECADPSALRQGCAQSEMQAPIRVRGEAIHMIAVTQDRYCRALLTADIRFLEEAAALTGARIEALLAERERAERQAREAKLLQLAAEAELKALRAQVNPHFLFNSLNTIADLIVTDPAKAETITVLLAKVFRHVLLYSDRQMTAVSEEIEFLRTYLRIEEVRFGERLKVRMDVDPAVSSARVPSLILQPVVENAIKHGLAPKIGPGNLQIRAGRDGCFVKLEVEDDGVGFAAGHNSPTGVGLKIIAERLKTLYQAGASLNCESGQTPGSRVTILIPLAADTP